MSNYLQDDGETVWVTPPSDATDADVDGIVRALESRLARGDRYTLVFRLEGVGLMSAWQRRRLAAHMTDNAESIRRSVVGLAIVAPSAVVRAAVTAIFWLAPPTCPYGVFTTRDEAATWIASLRGARTANGR